MNDFSQLLNDLLLTSSKKKKLYLSVNILKNLGWKIRLGHYQYF